MEKIKVRKGKNKRMIILFSIIGIVIVLAAAVLLTLQHTNTPTKGAPIARYSNPKSALLVLDLQNDVIGIYGDTSTFVENVNQAVALAEESGMEILYIKNIAGKNPIIQFLYMGKLRDGTKGAELDSRLRIANGNVFKKYIGDSFSSKEFERTLISKQVDTLYIVGADAAGCVYRTAQGGLNRKYNVNVITDAVITRDNKTMKQMLEKYTAEGIETTNLSGFQKLTQTAH
ncbi:MAG: cysteine hydrolase [Oscillospiraceae bacterium]|nr:cysteine hydrolase [Oscillospiraceae bacterium]